MSLVAISIGDVTQKKLPELQMLCSSCSSWQQNIKIMKQQQQQMYLLQNLSIMHSCRYSVVSINQSDKQSHSTLATLVR